jgi:hypothetical protein
VVEHIPPELADKVIANLCAATDRLLLSTSPRDYGEATHLNVQPPEFWASMLAREGFYRELDRDFAYITPWAALYTRREETVVDLVRDYDRSWSRSRQEAQELRESLLTLRQHLAEIEKVEPDAHLEKQIEDQREEILRLRDLLIGRDAELGAIRGTVTAQEEQTRALAALSQRTVGRIPGLTTVMIMLMRLLRGRL